MKLCRTLAGWLSPGGSRASLTILIFHRVFRGVDPLFPEEPDAARFDEILTWLAKTFTVLPLDRAISDLGSRTLPARAVSITFDDGYEDNASVALPILLRHRMTATFFVASDFLNGGRMWNDTVIESLRNLSAPALDLSAEGFGRYETTTVAEKRQAIDRLLQALKYLPPAERLEKAASIERACGTSLRNDLMMTSSQVLELRAAGMQIGGHTLSHPILTRLDQRAARDEIFGGKASLEAILGEPISLFAYPNGKPTRDYASAHVQMVKDAGFTAAVSTSSGVARAGTDVFQLPRFTPWDRSEVRFGLRMLNNMRTNERVAA